MKQPNRVKSAMRARRKPYGYNLAEARFRFRLYRWRAWAVRTVADERKSFSLVE